MRCKMTGSDGIVELVRKIKAILQSKSEYNANEERNKKYKKQNLSATKKRFVIYYSRQQLPDY